MKKRSILLLFSALLLGALTVCGFNDSAVKETPTYEAYQLTPDGSPEFTIDAVELTDIFVLPAVDLGYASTAYSFPAEKLAVNYLPVARPPPDRCQKSSLFNSKSLTQTVAINNKNESRAGFRVL